MTPITGLTTDWYRHGSTYRLRRELEKQLAVAENAFHAACRQTHDSEVARKYAEFKQLGEFIAQLGKADDGSADGDD